MVLSFVPSFLLWLFLLDENALLGGVWAVLLTLLASWGFDKMTRGWIRRALLLIVIPVLYWMVGPVCVVFFLLQAPAPQRRQAPSTMVWWGVRAFGCHACPGVILSPCASWQTMVWHTLPSLPNGIPVLLWAAALSVFVLTLIARSPLNPHRARRAKINAEVPPKSGHDSTLTSSFLFLLSGGCGYGNTRLEEQQYEG